MRPSKKPSNASLLLNGAALLVVLASFGTVLRSVFAPEETPPCRDRYTHGLRFSLERNGTLVSAAELQGEASNTDWGLTSAVRAVKLKSGPANAALELDLATAATVSEDKPTKRRGMGFHWTPDSFGNPQGACLVYSVFVPEDFAFGSGGRLPGLLGSFSRDRSDADPAFSARYMWSETGALDIYSQLPAAKEGRSAEVAPHAAFKMTPGKWTELEQEIVINTPGLSDGVLRVWQDGKLFIERKNVLFRVKPSAALSGVLVEMARADGAGGEKKQSPQKIWLSPLELRWNRPEQQPKPAADPQPPSD